MVLKLGGYFISFILICENKDGKDANKILLRWRLKSANVDRIVLDVSMMMEEVLYQLLISLDFIEQGLSAKLNQQEKKRGFV
jgi:hypothetical protein